MATLAPQRATDRVEAAAPAVAAVLLILWSANLPLAGGITTASVVVLAAGPLWMVAITSFRWAAALGVLSVAALVNGLVLALAKSSALPYSASLGLAQTLHLIGGLGGIGLILWARRHLSTPTIAILVGATVLLMGVAALPTSPNPWKYLLSVPITLVTLALLDRSDRGWLAIGALLGLAVVGVVHDSRSYAGACVLSAAVLLLPHRRKTAMSWARRLNWLALGATVLAAAYFLGTALLLGGALGAEVQGRSQAQLDRGGSLIGGGRPEWLGTLELARAHPEGFGLGAVPTYADVWIARAGLVRVGVSTDNGYVDNYMFGGQFKLHSVAADLWAQCGWFGLALALALTAALVLSLVDRIVTRTATPLLVFLGVQGVWNMSFAPIYSALPYVGLAVGLILLPKPAHVPRLPRGV